MTSLASIKIQEAQMLVDDAEARLQHDDPVSPSLAMVYSVHAVILAIDALCHHLGVPTPRRHDQVHDTFLNLIRRQGLPESAARHRETIYRAIREKALFEYQGEQIGRKEASRFLRQVRELVVLSSTTIRG